jgi:dipeptidyl aminopeptidase/acylaminoacyl peptidase
MSANGQSITQGLPPLIDRELLFGDPEIIGAEISPDGNYLAFLKPWNATRNVWVKKTSEPFSAARLLTTETKRPIPGFFWTRDSKYVGYVKDNNGDENYNVYAVAPDAAAAEGSEAPPSRDLTGLEGVRVELVSAPKSDPDILYIGLNDRDKAWHDLYKLRISTGERTLIRKNTEKIAGWTFDNEGRLRLALRVAENGDQEILRVDPEGFTKVYGCSIFESCAPLRFHRDGKKVYIETNRGDDVDLTSLILLDPETGETELVESDPLNRVDLGDALFARGTDELLLTSYTDERTRRYFKDKQLEADYQWLESQLPGREVDLDSHTLDERLWLVHAHGDTEPGETYLFDRKTRHLALQYKIRETLPREALAPMSAIRYRSSDGLEIPAYLVLPKAVPAEKLPTLVVVHGGPWARDEWGYNSFAQFFANRGYAILMPNFRGSTGFGKQFLNAGNGAWGAKMQDDVTWGVRYLVEQGIADPDRVGIIGGSYGGYAALAGVAFTPELYRAAVDIVGPSNLMTLVESIPPYWESFRTIMYARMADPNTAEGQEWFRERSPLTHAHRIQTPLLVVQGANDPRVNRREAEQIVVALRDRGFPVEYLLAEDEGHGFARPVNNMAMLMAAERFFAKHLGGRYQAGGKPEVVTRLSEITVDPATVTIAEKVDASSVGAPQPVRDLAPATYKYKAKVEIGDQQVPMTQTTSVTDGGDAWIVADVTESPMGESTDTTTLEKGTLLVRRREMRQDSAVIRLQVKGNRLDGEMRMDGQDHKIESTLSGPLFADAGGAQISLASLPLEQGYTTLFRNFDLMKQREKLLGLQVTGSEAVTVPAGTFDAWKVEITSADGGTDKQTLWIDKQTSRPVKVVAALAEMGGALMTAELAQ